MSRYKYRKIYVWDPNIAYLVGLFASDGCLVNNGRHLNITSKDIETVETVQKLLNMNVKISIKYGQFHTQAYQLQFSNVSLYDFLLNVGLTPAKSKTIGQLDVPDRYYADFLRGYFDGDGTVYGYWDRRWKNSFMFYTGFISASPAFLLWMQRKNQELINVGPGKIKPGIRAGVLTYAKQDSKKLFQYMYHLPNVPKLSRKHLKFVDFLERDPYAYKV